MEKPAITVIINGKTYRIRADAPEAIRAIPEADRAALVELLRVVDGQPLPAAAPAPAPVAAPVATPTSPSASPPLVVPVSAKEIDAMVNRLIREERASQTSLPSAQTIYLWMGGIVILLFLLMVMV